MNSMCCFVFFVLWKAKDGNRKEKPPTDIARLGRIALTHSTRAYTHAHDPISVCIQSFLSSTFVNALLVSIRFNWKPKRNCASARVCTDISAFLWPRTILACSLFRLSTFKLSCQRNDFEMCLQFEKCTVRRCYLSFVAFMLRHLEMAVKQWWCLEMD